MNHNDMMNHRIKETMTTCAKVYLVKGFDRHFFKQNYKMCSFHVNAEVNK